MRKNVQWDINHQQLLVQLTFIVWIKTALQNLFFSVAHTVRKKVIRLSFSGEPSRFREDKEMQILIENIQFSFMSIYVFFRLNNIFILFLFSYCQCVCCVSLLTLSLNCSSERWNPKPLNQFLHRKVCGNPALRF